MADRTFAGQLSRESEAWVAEGIVSAEQAAAIRSRYADSRDERRSSATTALAVIGAVAVGFGVIGFVAANWDAMSHASRLALLTLSVAASYAAGFHFRDRIGSRPRVGEALYLLGVLLFGASLFLVGQMYNVQAHDPLALLLWALGAIATALVVRSRVIAAASVLIFTAWIGWEFGLALDDAGGDTFGAFPAVAVFYGGALYGLATAARERLGGHWVASSGYIESSRGIGFPWRRRDCSCSPSRRPPTSSARPATGSVASCSPASYSSPSWRSAVRWRSLSRPARAGATRAACSVSCS
jgi:hypothetical protein